MNDNLPESIQKLIFEIDNAGKMNKSMISEIVNYGYIGKILAIRLITANGELEFSDIDLFFDQLIDAAHKLEKTLALTYA